MTSMHAQATSLVTATMLVALTLVMSGCSVAVPTVAPTAAVPTLEPTAAVPTLAPTAAVPTLAPTAAAPTLAPTAAAPTLAPTAAAAAATISSGSTAMVPLPALATAAWSPAPRTKTTGCLSLGGLPDPACTPGAIDARVTVATMTGTICASGYTATVRPSVALTDTIKREQMAAYGLQGQPPNAYELDHLISLELGGAPADVANLWPQPWSGEPNAHEKDAVETHLKREVCSGALSLPEAQRMIATDWVAVYHDKGLQPAP